MRNHSYIFIDVEAALIRGKQYIIEIGAVKWFTDGTKDSFSQLIRPYKFKKLNSHIQKLTGITTEQLLSAPNFKEVMKEFIHWCKGGAIFVTFGEFDRKVLEEELNRNHLDCQFLYPIVDFQQKYMIEHQIKEQPSLSGLMEELGISTSIQHRALADAISLLNIFDATNGEMMIEKQKTNQFVILLSECKQAEFDYELYLTYITGEVSNSNIEVQSIETLNKNLTFEVKEKERILQDGEVEIVQYNEIHPNREVHKFLHSKMNDLSNKVMITRSGLRQFSKLNRLHKCTVPKTEVMTLQKLLHDQEVVNEFTLNGQSIQFYEEKLRQVINRYKNNIIEEFNKRNLYIKEKVTLS